MTDRLLNLSQLENLTGVTFRTLRKRLEDLAPAKTVGKTAFYDPRQALPLIYQSPKDANLDLTKERARLAQAQANKTELEVKKMEGELVDANIWSDEWTRALVSFRDSLRNMALKITDSLVTAKTKEETYRIVSDHATSALAEIADSVGDGD